MKRGLARLEHDLRRWYLRRSRHAGATILFQVIMDGQMLGGIAPGTYHLRPLQPGEHIIAATSNENQESLLMVMEAGHNYVIQVVPR